MWVHGAAEVVNDNKPVPDLVDVPHKSPQHQLIPEVLQFFAQCHINRFERNKHDRRTNCKPVKLLSVVYCALHQLRALDSTNMKEVRDYMLPTFLEEDVLKEISACRLSKPSSVRL